MKKRKNYIPVKPRCTDRHYRVFDTRMNCYKCAIPDMPGLKFVYEDFKHYACCSGFVKRKD